MRRTLLTLLTTLLLVVAPYRLAFGVAESLTESDPVFSNDGYYYVDIVITADSADASFDPLRTTRAYSGILYMVYTQAGGTGPTDDSDLDVYTDGFGGLAQAAELLGTDGDDILDNAAMNYVVLSNERHVSGYIWLDMQNNAVNSGSSTVRLFFYRPATK